MCVLQCWSVIYLIQAIPIVWRIRTLIFHQWRTHIFFSFFCGEFTYFFVLFCKCLLNALWSDFGSIRSDENCTSEEQENITKSYCTFHHFPPFLRRKVDHCKLYRTNQSLRSLHCWSSALCYLLTIPFPKVRSVGISCLFKSSSN